MWSDLSAKHLLAFRAVVEEGTFGRAAERLGFTQSAISQQVASLEAMVGQSLFDRPAGPSRPRLTPAGDVLLEHATGLIEGIAEAERAIGRFARGVSGQLAIGTFQSISTRVLPLALRGLYEESQDVEVTLVEEDLGQDFWVELLLQGELDLAFVIDGLGHDPSDLEIVPLGVDPHVAVVPADYPEGPVDLAAMSGTPLVGEAANDTCGRLIDHQLERLGVTPHYAFRSHDNGAMQSMVAAGMGLALMPLLSVDTSDAGTSVRTTSPPLEPRRLAIAWPRNRTLSPVAERFVTIVQDVCRTMLAQAEAHVSAPDAG